MNKISAIIFVSIFDLVLQIGYCERIPELEENYFYKINSRLQDTVNKAFILMKLDKTFATEYKNRMLLTMHASMKSIAENNYDILEKVNESSRVDTANKPKDNLFNLDGPLAGLLKNITIPDIKHTIQKTISKLLLESRLLEVPKKVEDHFLYLREYLSNVKNIDIVEIAASTKHPLNREIMSYTLEYKKMKHLHHINRKRNHHHHLKLWQAPNSTQFDHGTRRLYDGQQVKIKKYPFVASVHVLDEFVCTGAILSDDMIITAASCLQLVFNNRSFLEYNPEGVAVRIGSDYTDQMGGKVFIDKVFFHPSYDPLLLRSNLAIIRINQRLHLKKNKKIKRIGYQRMEGQIPNTIRDIFVLGWGTTDEVKPNEMMLTYTRLDIYDTNECMNIYTKKFVTDKNFCAGFTQKRSGACQRDIGGPGVVGSTLMGVVSFGPPVCGTPDAPTVFTNIGYFIEWIDGILKGNSLTIQSPTTTTSIETSTKSETQSESSVQTPQVKKAKIVRTHPISATTSVSLNDPETPVKKTRKIYPKAVRLLKILLSEILDYDYDDYSITNPDTHLWEATKFNPFKHPLLNQSIFEMEPEDIKEITADPPIDSTRAELFFPIHPGLPLSFIARDAHNGQVQMFEEMDMKVRDSKNSKNYESQIESESNKSGLKSKSEEEEEEKEDEKEDEEEGLSIEIPPSYIKFPGSFQNEATEQPPIPPPPLRTYATEPTAVYKYIRTTPMHITIPFGVKYHQRSPTYPPTKKRNPNRFDDSLDKKADEILNNNFVHAQYPMEMPVTTDKMVFVVKQITTKIHRYRFVITRNDEMKNILRNNPRQISTPVDRLYKRVSMKHSKLFNGKKRRPTSIQSSIFKNVRLPDKAGDKPLFRIESNSVDSSEFTAILNESAGLDGLSIEIKNLIATTHDSI